MPFVNTRYQIAGGFDTPTAAAANYFEESEFSDTGYRRNFPSDGSAKSQFETEYHSFARLPSSASMETNGKARVPSLKQNSSGSWGKAALEVVGGVVDRVWQFCKAGAFSGFSAGGGQQYHLDPYHTVEAELDNQGDSGLWDSEITRKSTIFPDTSGRSITPVPGQYPDEESIYIVNDMDRATPECTPARATKRRQIDIGSNDTGLGKNWVVVPSTPATATSKLAGRYSMPTTSSASRRQTTSSASIAGRTTARPGHRRPLLHTRPSAVSHAGSPGLRSGPASFASPRSPGGSKIPVPVSSTSFQSALPSSPAAIEAQKWAAKKRKENIEADKSMSKLNAQLQAMIREGKEALGTTFEVKEIDEIAMGDADVDEVLEDSISSPSAKPRWR
jgi:hypothetical protein